MPTKLWGVGLDSAAALSQLACMSRNIEAAAIFNEGALSAVGLTREVVAAGITFVHKIIDGLDSTLVGNGETRLAQMVELANLSAIIGNLFRTGIARSSDGRFVSNGPHKYPDLLSTQDEIGDLEIKVALETNKPKGHLIKPGPHLTCRYVLGDPEGGFIKGKAARGDVPWIWEVRAGILEYGDFNESNTAGDSGKTAVINATGMAHLHPVYCSLKHCPSGAKSISTYEALIALHRGA